MHNAAQIAGQSVMILYDGLQRDLLVDRGGSAGTPGVHASISGLVVVAFRVLGTRAVALWPADLHNDSLRRVDPRRDKPHSTGDPLSEIKATDRHRGLRC